jgi:vanillate monooxygenase ferredoxin subunit
MLQTPVKMRLKVSAVEKAAEDIVNFELVADGDCALPPFKAGAHVDVHTTTGLVRQYSLCSDPADSKRYQIAVKLEPQSRGASKWMHEDLKAGDYLLIGQPRNKFPLTSSTGPAILMGGGIGVTPLISMAYELSAAGRQWHLNYFVRSHANAAFHSLLGSGGFAESVTMHVGLDVEGTRAQIESLVSEQSTGAHLYICGPRPFMDMITAFAEKNWTKGSLHLEHFTADPSLHLTGDSFEVVLAKSGRSVMVGPEETIVDALAAIGLPIETSCEQGICGTCVTRVIAGELDHRDAFLTDEEKRSGAMMTPCVSRARGRRIVLDV